MRTAEQALVTHPVKPVYDHPPEKLKHRTDFELYSLLDIVFIVAALVLTFWLSGLLLVHGVTSWRNLLYLLVLWVVLAYLALPRLHQLFTWLYVPDYFIGRTRTGDGLLGDPVNLAFDGTEADIHAVMQRAGWTRAEEITLRSSWRMIVSAVLRRSYAEAPVSDLFLFGRRHAFAYQQEVEGNPSQRHHIRFWPTPGDGPVPAVGTSNGWPRGPTIAPSGSPSSRGRSPTGSTPTSTWNATTSSPAPGTRIRPAPCRSSRSSRPRTTIATVGATECAPTGTCRSWT
jgi:hypothetical protein